MFVKNRKSLVVITPQSAQNPVVSLAEMKNYLRVDGETDNSLIEDFVKVATEAIAQFLRRSVVSQTLELVMDGFGGNLDSALDRLGPGVHDLPKSFIAGPDSIDLPFGPVSSITSIKTFSLSNTESTLSSAAYSLDGSGSRVCLNSGYAWPTSLRAKQAVKIRYVAGYSYTALPAPIRQAVREYAAAMYDCRRACEMPAPILSALSPYRVLDNMGFA